MYVVNFDWGFVLTAIPLLISGALEYSIIRRYTNIIYYSY